MLPPTAQKLPDITYDAPRIKWYANAADHPSIFMNEEKGFVRPVAHVPAPAASEPEVKKPLGPLIAEVAKVVGLRAKSLPDHGKYRVSAFYPAEESFVVDGRKTQSYTATASPARGSYEDCEVNTKIKVPFSRMEQFLRIAVYRVSLPNDTLVGEVSIPLADPDAESMGEYDIIDDNFEEQGSVFVKLRLPRDDDEAELQEPPFGSSGESLNEPPFGTQIASSSNQEGSPTGPPPPFSGVTQAGDAEPAQPTDPSNTGLISGASDSAKTPETSEFTPDGKYHVGQSWEYFSATAGTWVPARVGRILGWTIVLEYALRERPIDVRDEEAMKSLRAPEVESRVDGDSFFLSLRQQEEFGAAPPADGGETEESAMQGKVSGPAEEQAGSKPAETAEEGSDNEGSSSSGSSSSSSGSASSSPKKANGAVAVQGTVPVSAVPVSMAGLPSGAYMQATSSNGQVRYVAQGGGYVIHQPQQLQRGPSSGLPSQPYVYPYPAATAGTTAAGTPATVHPAPGSYAVQPPSQPQSQGPYVQQPQSQLQQQPQSTVTATATASSPYVLQPPLGLQAGLAASAHAPAGGVSPYSQYNGTYAYNYSAAATTTPATTAATTTAAAGVAASGTAGFAQPRIQASASPYAAVAAPVSGPAGAVVTAGPYYYPTSVASSASAVSSVAAAATSPGVVLAGAASTSYMTAQTSTPQVYRAPAAAASAPQAPQVAVGQYYQAAASTAAPQSQVVYGAHPTAAAAVATPYVIPSSLPAPSTGA